jgi:hypothetical protein
MLVTPVEMMRVAFEVQLMALRAQQVIAMRMLGAMGAWNVHPSESMRMTSEKVAAMTEASVAMGSAMARAKSPAIVAGAAVKPFARRTKSNARRLARRGPA